MIKKTILFLIIYCLAYSVSAQIVEHNNNVSNFNRDSCTIYFKVGSSQIDSTLYGNSQALEILAKKLKEAIREDSININIYPYASLEGSMERNQALQYSRGMSIKRYIESTNSMAQVNLYQLKDPYNWDAVEEYISKSKYPNKSMLLQVLKETPAFEYDIKTGKKTYIKKAKFMNFLTQQQWNDLNIHCFPEMRKVDILIDKYLPDTLVAKRMSLLKENPYKEYEENIMPIEVMNSDVEPVSIEDKNPIQEKEEKPFYMSLRTNLLYDVALVPNIGIEFYLGKNWTAGINWMYAWWNIDSKHIYWRTYGGDFNIRKYFGKAADSKPLTGHHIGAYGQILTYDFETGGTGFLAERWSWGAGVEYGYALPVARRLNIDFSIGMGYSGGEYKIYNPQDGHYVWNETRQRHWFGPTKIEISLVWLIGRGNSNEKGGKQ